MEGTLGIAIRFIVAGILILNVALLGMNIYLKKTMSKDRKNQEEKTKQKDIQ